MSTQIEARLLSGEHIGRRVSVQGRPEDVGTIHSVIHGRGYVVVGTVSGPSINVLPAYRVTIEGGDGMSDLRDELAHEVAQKFPLYPSLAQFIRAYGDRRAAEALREAAEDLDRLGHLWSGPRVPAYFESALTLRDRADSIDPTTREDDHR